jgi:hypothetical protein
VQKLSVFERREVIITSRSNVPDATGWYFDVKKHTAGTVISVPEAMTLAEALRALGGYSAVQLAKAAEMHPKPLERGTMLMLRR